ncbi:hypothetical protein Tco_0732447, partial [Tanacetum coccineum]
SKAKDLRQLWENSDQTGELVQIAMIQKLLSSKLGSLMDKFGDFDFIICQNPYTYFVRSATETESYEGSIETTAFNRIPNRFKVIFAPPTSL